MPLSAIGFANFAYPLKNRGFGWFFRILCFFILLQNLLSAFCHNLKVPRSVLDYRNFNFRGDRRIGEANLRKGACPLHENPFNGGGTAARARGVLGIREGADFPFRGLGITGESSETFDAMIFEAEMRRKKNPRPWRIGF